MIRPLACTGFLILALGARGAAQDPRFSRLDAETRSVVAAIIDSARAQGLPSEPLVDRALEGAAKGAPGSAIVAAVRRLAADLGHARDALGAGASAAELDAAAAALRAGATTDVLTRLRRERGGRPIIIPLAVLADLVAGGVPADTAARAVLALAADSDDQLIEFRRTVERDIALGAPPGAAAEGRLATDAYGGVQTPARPRPGRP